MASYNEYCQMIDKISFEVIPDYKPTKVVVIVGEYAKDDSSPVIIPPIQLKIKINFGGQDAGS